MHPPSAVDRVLSLPELLPLILAHLPWPQLFPLQRVSRTFRHLILSSPSLREKMSLSALLEPREVLLPTGTFATTLPSGVVTGVLHVSISSLFAELLWGSDFGIKGSGVRPFNNNGDAAQSGAGAGGGGTTIKCLLDFEEGDRTGGGTLGLARRYRPRGGGWGLGGRDSGIFPARKVSEIEPRGSWRGLRLAVGEGELSLRVRVRVNPASRPRTMNVGPVFYEYFVWRVDEVTLGEVAEALGWVAEMGQRERKEVREGLVEREDLGLEPGFVLDIGADGSGRRGALVRRYRRLAEERSWD